MSFNIDSVVGILRARGLKVVEVEGWFTRGYAGQNMDACNGVLWHHTATPSARNPAAGNMPTLNMLTYGHSTLAGPLCNIGLGRDGTCYIVATGLANHAGTGYWPGVPQDQGNRRLIGIEMESSGTFPWDWTPEQLAAAPILGAALELAYCPGGLQLAHYEYSNAGKIDPAGWPGEMDGLRASINAQINSWNNGGNTANDTEMDFDMATIAEVFNFPIERSDGKGTITLASMLKYYSADIASINTNVGKVKNLVGDIQTANGPVSLRQFVANGTRAAQQAAAQTAAIRRGGNEVSLRQEVADTKTTVTASAPVIVEIAKAVEAAPVDGGKK